MTDPRVHRWNTARQYLHAVALLHCQLLFSCNTVLFCRTVVLFHCLQDHLLDVATNSVALASAILTAQLGWWVDPLGAILLVLYTLVIWARTLHENCASLAALSACPGLLGRVIRAALASHGLVLSVPWIRSWLVGDLYIIEVRVYGVLYPHRWNVYLWGGAKASSIIEGALASSTGSRSCTQASLGGSV